MTTTQTAGKGILATITAVHLGFLILSEKEGDAFQFKNNFSGWLDSCVSYAGADQIEDPKKIARDAVANMGVEVGCGLIDASNTKIDAINP
jgi:hypothetical protein